MVECVKICSTFNTHFLIVCYAMLWTAHAVRNKPHKDRCDMIMHVPKINNIFLLCPPEQIVSKIRNDMNSITSSSSGGKCDAILLLVYKKKCHATYSAHNHSTIYHHFRDLMRVVSACFLSVYIFRIVFQLKCNDVAEATAATAAAAVPNVTNTLSV